ncbi:DNA glycosylase [Cyathus striatus]|nr:DNA glycosylase [Cyathus striatus]
MPTTRSSSIRFANATQPPPPTTSTRKSESTPRKRKSGRSSESTTQSNKKRKESSVETIENSRSQGSALPPTAGVVIPTAPTAADVLVPAVLTFSLEAAKSHLVSVDQRFEDLFVKMECKPFEELDRVHPFRALTMSILGQQVSWMAARSIMHKFRRLYDRTLPEKPDDEDDSKSVTSSFPTPEQVAKTDIATLRTAGLSQRKAEYVQGLAERFADGHLSTEKLINADDDALTAMLIDVRGIGMWTVNMFAIFSLRRPDILPVGDLGVQRGVVRWFLSLHSSTHRYSISPEKVSSGKKESVKDSAKSQELPSLQTAVDREPADASSVPPSTVPTTGGDGEMPSLPPTFTPSIKNVLEKVPDVSHPPKLPAGLTVSELKSRLKGKKIRGALLTPKEMEDLTEAWKPYRSIAVYYMWSLADVDTSE